MRANKPGMNFGLEVQREPYAYLLTQQEKQSARCLPFRMAFNGMAAGMSALYYMSRHNELNRLKALRVSFDLIFGLTWRVLLTTVAADQVSRRLFVNRLAIRGHKMADYEVKKVMRTWPQAKPHLRVHEKPNSYFWC